DLTCGSRGCRRPEALWALGWTARVARVRRGAPSGAAVAHRQRVGHGDRAEETCHGVDPIKSLRVVRLAASSSVVFADVVDDDSDDEDEEDDREGAGIEGPGADPDAVVCCDHAFSLVRVSGSSGTYRDLTMVVSTGPVSSQAMLMRVSRATQDHSPSVQNPSIDEGHDQPENAFMTSKAGTAMAQAVSTRSQSCHSCRTLTGPVRGGRDGLGPSANR